MLTSLRASIPSWLSGRKKSADWTNETTKLSDFSFLYGKGICFCWHWTKKLYCKNPDIQDIMWTSNIMTRIRANHAFMGTVPEQIEVWTKEEVYALTCSTNEQTNSVNSYLVCETCLSLLALLYCLFVTTLFGVWQYPVSLLRQYRPYMLIQYVVYEYRLA